MIAQPDDLLSEYPLVHRSGIAERLAQTERHVAQGRKHVRRQRQLIGQLERDGDDATTPRKLLAPFEEALALHLATRERLLAELNAQGLAYYGSIEQSRHRQRVGRDVRQAFRQSLAEILAKEYAPLAEMSAELRTLLKRVDDSTRNTQGNSQTSRGATERTGLAKVK
jgi:hypothetical protein